MTLAFVHGTNRDDKFLRTTTGKLFEDLRSCWYLILVDSRNLNIAVSYEKFATSKSGGARESLLTLLEGIADHRDLTVTAFQSLPNDDPPETNYECSIRVHEITSVPKLKWIDQVVTRRRWGRYFRRELSDRFDLLLTQNRFAPISTRIADEFGIPSLFFIRSMALTGYEKYDPTRSTSWNISHTDLGGRIQYPFLRRNFEDYRQGAEAATRVIANSSFTASLIDELLGVEADIIYPPIDLDTYRVEYEGDGFITMVNPRAVYKGADVFLDIASALPDEKFLLVGTLPSRALEERAERLPNMTHWGWREDMREVYSRTKLVVVPSRWEEPFGRVPAEAMVSGIPCVVSYRGGLPEVVGQTGEIVSDVSSTEAWVDAIERALRAHDPEAQKDRAENFSAERQVSKLVDLIDEVVDASPS